MHMLKSKVPEKIMEPQEWLKIYEKVTMPEKWRSVRVRIRAMWGVGDKNTKIQKYKKYKNTETFFLLL